MMISKEEIITKICNLEESIRILGYIRSQDKYIINEQILEFKDLIICIDDKDITFYSDIDFYDLDKIDITINMLNDYLKDYLEELEGF